jgi:heptosyltransferase-3
LKRFDDQPLGSQPHLAVLFQDKIGGFVVATPLLRGLKEKYPSAVLDYFGGERTEELETACPYIDARYSLYGPSDAVRGVGDFIRQREIVAGAYDLAINLDFNPLSAVVTAALNPRFVVGRSFRSDGRGELPLGETQFDEMQRPTTYWASDDFLARFGDAVDSNFIGEIFCRLARVETDYQRTEVPTREPPFDVPDVLIATGGTRQAKVWPASAWKRLLALADDDGITVGLLGAAPEIQKAAYRSAELEADLLASSRLIDLRGRLTLPEVAGALRRARACVTIDNGIMHLAAAVQTPTIALFGASPSDLWAPRVPWLHLALPTEACSMCRDNHYLNDACLRDRHVCMLSIRPERVFEQLLELLAVRPAEA